MVYTRFGNEFEIIGCVTDVKVESFDHPLTLVKSKDGDFRFAEFLKADGGFREIDGMVKLADPLNLSESELRQAIDDAL